MTESSDTYNILAPAKKLSQLIAKSWLEKEHLTIDREYLIEHDILTEEEANYFTTIKAHGGSKKPAHRGRVDVVGKSIEIAHHLRPPSISDEVIEAWINSPSNAAPWIPEDSELAKWLTVIQRYDMMP